MKVLFSAAEMFPWIKVGGLGDVIGSLPPALRERGIDARVLLPGYADVHRAIGDARSVLHLPDLHGRPAVVRASTSPRGVPVYVIDAPHLFGDLDDPYVNDDATHRRFGALAFVASEITRRGLDDGFRPDLLHVHDWQSGLAPVYLAFAPESERRPSMITIHNVAYQGNFPPHVLADLGLPRTAYSMEGVEFYGQVGFLKGGLACATKITTVSPTYAEEIVRPDGGRGLEGLLAHRRRDLLGILNGIDTTYWDPSREGGLAVPFDAATLDRRAASQRSLRERVRVVAREGALLFGVVSRLVLEKGMDSLIDALPRLRAAGGQLVVLGRGDARLECRLAEACAASPDDLAFVSAHDESLAMAIYAGIDVLLVPSIVEPCGLTQMYAMRYGALPLVRRTGGLADTVVDAVAPPPSEPTGFVYVEPTADALATSIERACVCFRRDRARWQRMQQNGMRRDFSWNRSSASYAALYESLVPS